MAERNAERSAECCGYFSLRTQLPLIRFRYYVRDAKRDSLFVFRT